MSRAGVVVETLGECRITAHGRTVTPEASVMFALGLVLAAHEGVWVHRGWLKGVLWYFHQP